jgi:hypothetical protein
VVPWSSVTFRLLLVFWSSTLTNPLRRRAGGGAPWPLPVGVSSPDKSPISPDARVWSGNTLRSMPPRKAPARLDVASGKSPAQAGHIPAQRIKVLAARDHKRAKAYGSGKQPLGRASAGNCGRTNLPSSASGITCRGWCQSSSLEGLPSALQKMAAGYGFQRARSLTVIDPTTGTYANRAYEWA